MTWVLYLFLVLLAGCADMPPEVKAEEAGFQVIAALDMGQTLRLAAGMPNYHEANKLLGMRPHRDAVVAYFVVGAVAHLVATDYLCRYQAPRTVIRLWEGLTTLNEAVAVIGNVDRGITP